MESKFNIAGKIAKLEAAKVELPRLIAEAGQAYFQLNFRKQQWDGTPWEPRADNAYGRKMAGHLLLVGKSGDLRRAMQNTILNFNWDKIIWAVKDVSYAKYINQGTENMPARQIIGIDEGLLRVVDKKVSSEFNKIMS